MAIKTTQSRKRAVPRSLLQRILRSARFPRYFGWLALAVLCASTLFWSYLGARLHASNADQLADAFMFGNMEAITNAQFPGAHSFLLKWPLFALNAVMGLTPLSFVIVTMFMAVLTVGGLAYVLYRIERRPLVFGCLLLALSAVLLLIPAAPYAGALLPVNMAMSTTRNIEYLFFIVGLALAVKAPHMRHRYTLYSVTLLGVLIASDKLFLALAVGAAGLTLGMYSLCYRERLRSAIRLFATTLSAGLLGYGILMLVQAAGIGIVGETSATPYAFSQGARGLALGGLYAILNILTNFGANPAFDAPTISALPSVALRRWFMPGGVAYVINLGIMATGVILSVRLVKSHLSTLPKAKTKRRKHLHAHDQPAQLAVLLLAATVVSVGIFTLTDHYYAVDARYLTIALFAICIASATYLRSWSPTTGQSLAIGIVLGMTCLIAAPLAWQTHRTQTTALEPINVRNQRIAMLLADRPNDILVGDYWRVLPISQLRDNKHNLMLPLETCTQERNVLVSRLSNTQRSQHSFTYLLSGERGLTDFPACSIEQVTAVYGQPDRIVPVDGSTDSLLLYDRPLQTTADSSTLDMRALKPINCPKGSIMNIVAHQDDDLLFLNPDLQNSLDTGACVQTIYVTAGDDGHGEQYWLGRERGTRAAYDVLLRQQADWQTRSVRINDAVTITRFSPKNNDRIGLWYLRLPDGDLDGSGFQVHGRETLAKLLNGTIPTLRSVDRRTTYDRDQLITTLQRIIDHYQPSTIRTQSDAEGTVLRDHSDHGATSQLAKAAAGSTPVQYYLGYPVRERPANVGGTALAHKQAAFFAYGKYDGAVCRSVQDCQQTETYSNYLTRQYVTP